jgi:hypothetical protein
VPTAIPRWGGALAALATAVAVTGCGSGNTTTSGPTHTTATATATVDTTASSTAPQARSATVAAGCTAAHTTVSLGATGAATGHLGITLLFHNSGAAPCTLTGFPGAALTSRHRVLHARRTLRGFLGGLSPQARVIPGVRLAAGGYASALLEGEDVNAQTNAACPSYSDLLVTPPNQRVTARLHRSLEMCNPEIHPVVAGTTGRQGS